MKSNLVSKSETAALVREISSAWGIELGRSRNLHVFYLEDGARIIRGDDFVALNLNDTYLPFLADTGMLSRFPSVTVDMGAVRFVCNGANLMRPGITRHDEFQKGDLVCIMEESRSKFLAVGVATIQSSELADMQKGEVLRNMHYISDKFWEIGKEIPPRPQKHESR